jgi:cysteine desulfurase
VYIQVVKRIYLDYASLTPVDKRVQKEIKKYSGVEYGNPSALYASAVSAKNAIANARTRVAEVLHAHADEIFFTASGTEANNIALRAFGTAAHGSQTGAHIVVSSIEHSSIIETARALEKKGNKVTYISVNSNGLVDLENFKKSLTPETILVSVMLVNNEVGTIEPIQDIAKIVRDFRKKNNSVFPLLHTDACQASLLPLHVEKLGVDLITLDGHKIYGPRGVGMLYIRRSVLVGLKIEPVITGGGQEKGLRSGTENVPGIMGFALALERTDALREKESRRLSALRTYFIDELKKKIPQAKVNGVNENPVHNGATGGLYELTSPHIVNVSIPGIDNEFFVLKLDAKGIECSTKSACLKDEDESYVLRAMDLDSSSSIRFSFGRETTKNDLKKVIKNCIL